MSAMRAQREGQEQGSGAQCNKGGRTGSRGRSGWAFGLVVGYSVLVVVLAALMGWCGPAGACGGAAVGKLGWEGVGTIEGRAVAEAAAARLRKMGAVADSSCLLGCAQAARAELQPALRLNVWCSGCRSRNYGGKWGGVGVGIGVGVGAGTGVGVGAGVVAATAQWQPQHSGSCSTMAATAQWQVQYSGSTVAVTAQRVCRSRYRCRRRRRSRRRRHSSAHTKA